MIHEFNHEFRGFVHERVQQLVHQLVHQLDLRLHHHFVHKFTRAFLQPCSRGSVYQILRLTGLTLARDELQALSAGVSVTPVLRRLNRRQRTRLTMLSSFEHCQENPGRRFADFMQVLHIIQKTPTPEVLPPLS